MQIATQKEIEIVNVVLHKLQTNKINFKRFVRIAEAIIRRQANRQERIRQERIMGLHALGGKFGNEQLIDLS